ncbi:MAG: branched-chain amino acid ABC transporter permease [Haloferacaceae archaeon]
MVLVDSVVPLAVNTDLIITQLFNGIVLGMNYVLIAVGLSLIFGMMNIINFAHGGLLLLGAYAAYTVTAVTGSFFAALVIAPLLVGVVGAAIERTALRRIYEEELFLQLLLTFGFAQLLQGLVEFVWGRTDKQIPIPDWGATSIDFVVFTYPVFRLFVLGISTAVIVALYLFITRTDMGLIIRASIEDREMVGALGIGISKIYLAVFGIGCALAGLAGALIGPIQGVNPALGFDILVPAFVVVVVGGMGSLVGSLVSGLLIGLLIALTTLVYPAASNVVIYVFMALVLLVRPGGLFGIEGALEA